MYKINPKFKTAMDIGRMLDKGLFFSVVNINDGSIKHQAMFEYQCAPYKTRSHDIIKTSSLPDYLNKLAGKANG
ncbi:hypothetical protein ACJVQT_22920 [Enterobacter huaxiensis]|uniref:hypothetical protein n=1 Tax=Enterobacter huaxiensis TaxID=2494702 RepID=UPI003966E5FF|nr:hypothetical protein [Enterobacter huaxiensis]